MSQKINVYAEILTPRVPNFLRFADGNGTISIADVTDESLRAMGQEWIEELVRHAIEPRKQPRESGTGGERE